MARFSLRHCGLALIAVVLSSCASEVSSSVAAARRPETVTAVSCGMFPAFGRGDRLQIDRHPGELRRGDIVYHQWSDPGRPEAFYIHRIVGLPGEQVDADADGRILISGTPLVEDYLPAGTATHLAEAADIPADHYFVLGDNRERSSDSRVLGPLPRPAITARITKVIPVKVAEDEDCS